MPTPAATSEHARSSGGRHHTEQDVRAVELARVQPRLPGSQRMVWLQKSRPSRARKWPFPSTHTPERCPTYRAGSPPGKRCRDQAVPGVLGLLGGDQFDSNSRGNQRHHEHDRQRRESQEQIEIDAVRVDQRRARVVQEITQHQVRFQGFSAVLATAWCSRGARARRRPVGRRNVPYASAADRPGPGTGRSPARSGRRGWRVYISRHRIEFVSNRRATGIATPSLNPPSDRSSVTTLARYAGRGRAIAPQKQNRAAASCRPHIQPTL